MLAWIPMVPGTWVRTYVLIMLCHNFLIRKGHTCALRTTCVVGGHTAASWERERMQGNTHLHSRYRPHTTASMARSTAGIATTTYVRTYVRTYRTRVPAIAILIAVLAYQKSYCNTHVHVYKYYNIISKKLEIQYTCTYTCTMVPWYSSTYTCTVPVPWYHWYARTLWHNIISTYVRVRTPTMPYRDGVPVAPECLYFKSFLRCLSKRFWDTNMYNVTFRSYDWASIAIPPYATAQLWPCV